MKVFISYGDIADQVTALRLQALGAVNGLTVYVPPPTRARRLQDYLTRRLPKSSMRRKSCWELLEQA